MEVIKREIEIDDPNPRPEYIVALPPILSVAQVTDVVAYPPKFCVAIYRLWYRPTRTKAVYRLKGVRSHD